MAQFGREHNVMMEVFVHGSYCIGFSGICYISSARNGASGNRGRCSQPCREQYETTKTGNNYPLNMKDNSAFGDLEALADAGVYSLKVEGRIKKSHYVYTVVDNWRQQIDRLCEGLELAEDTTELYTVFNRDFSNAFLQGDFGKAMYIDNP
ncbi:U32 family peptidase, partial [Escherichia coli]|nr:U32 family peptidase [Escherichia coli]